MPNRWHARKPVKTKSSCRALATCKLQTSFSPLVQTDNHVVQKFDVRKIYKLSNEVIFFAPFLVCFSLFAFKLGATATLCLRHCLVPRRLSFDENVRAKEGGKETRLPSVPFPWSLAVHHRSLAFRL